MRKIDCALFLNCVHKANKFLAFDLGVNNLNKL